MCFVGFLFVPLYFLLKDTFPLRFREIHIIHESMFFHVVFALIKPFLSDTIKSRVRCPLRLPYAGRNKR